MMLVNQMTTTLMNNIEIFMTNIPAIIAMFVATEILEVVLCMLFIGFSVKMFLKVYKNACEELTVKEFIMLVLPMLAQVVCYQSVINYYDLYDKAMKAGVIERRCGRHSGVPHHPQADVRLGGPAGHAPRAAGTADGN